MAEYIEREALLKAIDTSLHNNPHENRLVAKTHNDEHRHFLSMVLAQPAADVVEVVRCKDCKRFIAVPERYPYMKYCDLHSIGVSEEDFCSFSERKEGAEE